MTDDQVQTQTEPEEEAAVEAAIKTVRDALTSEDPAEINAKTDALQTSFHKVSEAMYERAQQQSAAAQGNGAAADGDGASGTAEAEEDVVDAEVVDEGKS